MNLVIIEGVGKQETIKKYLGKDYEVVASKGHIRDLPVKKLGVNIQKRFEPEYEILPDKKDIVKMLKQKAAKADKILLATDPDREGEAISWHLAHILGLNENDKIRIVFNEISKNAITNALKEPRGLNKNLINAQQARRVLDRLVGYKVSPILCKKIQPKLSAGRVQSVALKLIVNRENEIRNFKPEEYWTLSGLFYKTIKTESFKASLIKFNNKKITITTGDEMQAVLDVLKSGNYVVSNVKKSVGKTRPYAPYTTSTMQQDALNKLGFNLKKVSACAQQLYEGVNIEGEGKVALVTYIRTDSVRISPDASLMAKEYILNKFGEKYYPKTPNFYKTKASAQDAHEAIRPISLERTPEKVKAFISVDNYKLYKLIYDRFLASQMTENIYNLTVVEIENSNYIFKASGKTPVFDGYQIVYNYDKENKKNKNSDKTDKDESADEEESVNDKLPELIVGDKLNLIKLTDSQKFTKPPVRYTEASLVKEMEEKGIGRPATYTPTITILSSRNYAEKEGKYLKPTPLAEKINDLLEKYFSDIINIEFTAKMEDRLDEIAQKEMEWQKVVEDFYSDFEKKLKQADSDYTKFKLPPKETNEICEKCGSKMVIRTGRYGEFLACSNYPACKNIKSLKVVKKVGKCPKCGGDILEKTSKKGKIFYGCSNYPDCNFASWEIPLEEKCPKCSSYLTKKEFKEKTRIKCSNTDCDYTETK